MDQTLAQQGYVPRQQYQQYRQQPNPMMGFNPLMGGYGGGTGRFDGSQMPQFAGPDPAMGGPRNNGNAFPGGGYPRYGGGGYQQPSQNYGNIAALFSQLFGGGGMGGSMFGTGSFGGQGGSPVNSYNPFGNMMGSAGPNPLMGGFSSPGGGNQWDMGRPSNPNPSFSSVSNTFGQGLNAAMAGWQQALGQGFGGMFGFK